MYTHYTSCNNFINNIEIGDEEQPLHGDTIKEKEKEEIGVILLKKPKSLYNRNPYKIIGNKSPRK